MKKADSDSKMSVITRRESERNLMFDRKLVLSWTRLTWLGWILGIPIIVVLALIGEAVGMGGSQFIVGVGVGLGVGLLQSRAMRGILGKAKWWIYSSMIALGAPFLVTDISNLVGGHIPYSLPVATGFGGLIVGIWQSLLLRTRFRRTLFWIGASILGWTAAAGLPSISQLLLRTHSVRGIWGALAYLGLAATGGLVLGLITGVCLAMLPRHEVMNGEVLTT